MVSVGIIANPASGKDIRRLVAHGSVFDNDEKVSIVKRVLLGLEAVGVDQVWIMPDRFGIGLKALDGLHLTMQASIMEMPAFFNQEDSRRATEMMVERGVRTLVTLGGDGTNRMVAKACGNVPLMPISTGTNNVFPLMIEATTAGLAAGLVAVGKADAAVSHTLKIDVFRIAPDGTTHSEPDDLALIDAVVYAERFVASRAIWEADRIREILLTRAEPGNIGISSIASHLLAGDYPLNHGIFLRTSNDGQRVLAPIAPGLIRPVYIAEHRLLAPGDEVIVRHSEPCVLAFDGEREVELRSGAAARLRLSAQGPRVISPRDAVAVAARAGAFR